MIAAALAIAAKDLRIEWRHRTAVITAVTFAVIVLLVFVFARDEGSLSLQALAPSVLWVVLSLSAVVTLNRAFLLEREDSAIDGLLLAPVSRQALFWGKWIANTVFVLAIEAIALPLWVVFFGLDFTPRIAGVAGAAVLATFGFTALGTLFSAMAVRTRFAELLLPVLLLPFMLPPLYFASELTLRLLAARPISELWGWLRLLALYDLAFVTLAAMLFPVVMDE